MHTGYLEGKIMAKGITNNQHIPVVLGRIRTLLFLCALPFLIQAQDTKRFVHLTPEDGLSNGNIVSMLQDYEGYMWIGTAEGLNKYDGQRFETFKSVRGDTTTLSGNYIFALLQDKHKNLWVGVDNGLCLYNRDLNRFDVLDFPDENNQPFIHKVGALHEDNKGQLWVGTNRGAYILDRVNKKFVPVLDKIIQKKDVSQIGQDSEGNMILSFFNLGLLKWNPQSGQSVLYNTEHPTLKLNENNIYTFAIDAQKRIWIGYYSQGISMLDEANQRIVHYQHDPRNPNSLPNNYISSLAIYPNGPILIATNGGGLSILDPQNREFSNYMATDVPGSIISNSVNKLYFGPDGMLWAGCWGSGVSIYDKRYYKFTHFWHNANNQKSLSGKSVTSFAEDRNGNIWISTDGGGIDCFDVKRRQFTNFKSSNNKVLALAIDTEGDLWSGMWNGGLNQFKIEGQNLILKNSYPSIRKGDNTHTSIFYLQPTPKGELWIGTFEAGVFRYNSKEQTFTSLRELINFENDTIEQLTVNDITISPQNNIWISTQDFGLLKVNLEKQTHHLYQQNLTDSLGQPAKLINFTFQDSRKRTWVGTNVGLSLFDPEKETFRTYTTAHGLPDNNVVGMLEDDHGNLWISSNKGLSKITVLESNSLLPQFEIRNYGMADGLQGNLFNRWAFFKSRTGTMYFGGLNGFNVFHPDSITDNPHIPPVHLTDFYLYNERLIPGKEDSPLKKELSQTEEIVLKYNQNYFTIRFVAINFIMSEKNKYAYMLEGLDKDWNYVDNKNEATYTLLKPGKYTFKVKASNNDGRWNEEGTSVRITILPPWWGTWWFRIFILLIVGVQLFYISIRFFAYFRSLANQTILNERNQLQTLIDNIPDQVFIKDRSSRFVVANKRTAAHLGVTDPKLLIDRSDLDFFNPEKADYFIQQEKTIMETRISIINQESEFETKGQMRYLSITKCPIINSKNETIGLVGIIRDITNQKKSEIQIVKQSRELQKMNKTLSENNQLLEIRQNVIEEQAEELFRQKEELLKSNEQLNQLVATKDKLFSIVAHDIRNPFNSILGFSELLLNNMDSWNDEEKLNAAQIIFNSSTELSALLENLLQWSRNQRGMVSSLPTTIDAYPFVENQLQFFKYSLNEKGIEANNNLPIQPIKLHTDPQLLDTIFRNLLGNAIKFTPKGGTIQVDMEQNETMAVFCISDNGIGIPAEKLEHLFDIRDQKTTRGTNNEKGSGLGLILVKEFVEKQGGTIWVDSTLRQGSRFYFSVPLA